MEKSLEDTGDAGEHEVEIPVWHPFENTMDTELFTLTSAMCCIGGSNQSVESSE